MHQYSTLASDLDDLIARFAMVIIVRFGDGFNNTDQRMRDGAHRTNAKFYKGFHDAQIQVVLLVQVGFAGVKLFDIAGRHGISFLLIYKEQAPAAANCFDELAGSRSLLVSCPINAYCHGSAHL